MADLFKRLMHYHCDIGGIYCKCYNMWVGKHKRKLNKIARSNIKQEDIKKEKKDE